MITETNEIYGENNDSNDQIYGMNDEIAITPFNEEPDSFKNSQQLRSESTNSRPSSQIYDLPSEADISPISSNPSSGRFTDTTQSTSTSMPRVTVAPPPLPKTLPRRHITNKENEDQQNTEEVFSHKSVNDRRLLFEKNIASNYSSGASTPNSKFGSGRSKKSAIDDGAANENVFLSPPTSKPTTPSIGVTSPLNQLSISQSMAANLRHIKPQVYNRRENQTLSETREQTSTGRLNMSDYEGLNNLDLSKMMNKGTPQKCT